MFVLVLFTFIISALASTQPTSPVVKSFYSKYGLMKNDTVSTLEKQYRSTGGSRTIMSIAHPSDLLKDCVIVSNAFYKDSLLIVFPRRPFSNNRFNIIFDDFIRIVGGTNPFIDPKIELDLVIEGKILVETIYCFRKLEQLSIQSNFDNSYLEEKNIIMQRFIVKSNNSQYFSPLSFLCHLQTSIPELFSVKSEIAKSSTIESYFPLDILQLIYSHLSLIDAPSFSVIKQVCRSLYYTDRMSLIISGLALNNYINTVIGPCSHIFINDLIQQKEIFSTIPKFVIQNFLSNYSFDSSISKTSKPRHIQSNDIQLINLDSIKSMDPLTFLKFWKERDEFFYQIISNLRVFSAIIQDSKFIEHISVEMYKWFLRAITLRCIALPGLNSKEFSKLYSPPQSFTPEIIELLEKSLMKIIIRKNLQN